MAFFESEWFRDLGNYRMLAFGLAMVLIMVFRPRGLIAHREPSLRLHPVRRAGPRRLAQLRATGGRELSTVRGSDA